MSGLTDLTLRQALDALGTRKISSEELTGGYIAAIEAARPLNAFVLETPEKALEMARASDHRRASAEAGPLAQVRTCRWLPPPAAAACCPAQPSPAGCGCMPQSTARLLQFGTYKLPAFLHLPCT